MQRKSKLPVINQRYESKAQVDRFKRAARSRRLSLNSFMLVAAERLAAEILETGKTSEQLMAGISQPALNQ